jgi:DNA-binding response OmpR family regulator
MRCGAEDPSLKEARVSKLRPPDRPCIMLVEDEPIIAADIESCLGKNGFRIAGPFSTVSAALRNLSSLSLAGALLDINVSGEKVYPVADRLSESGVPFLFVSSASRRSLPQRFRDRPFLGKPLALGELVRAVRFHCGDSPAEQGSFQGIDARGHFRH